MTARRFRLGSHAAAKDPTLSPLVTIWSYDPAQEPDGLGRRDDDVLVGALPRRSAALVVELVNGAPDPGRAAAYVAAVIESEMVRVGARVVRLARGHAGGFKADREPS
jgi:hypothetical protein